MLPATPGKGGDRMMGPADNLMLPYKPDEKAKIIHLNSGNLCEHQNW